MTKRWLTIGVCVVLLLSLTACGGRCDCYSLPLPEDADYRYGTEQLELGNLAKAYGYFKDSADPRAAEMLEKFVFVPTKLTEEHSDSGQNIVTTYTYDEAGRLLEEKMTGNSQWNTPVNKQDTYVYDPDGRVVKRTYCHDNHTFIETYTYNDNGDELTYSYFLDGDEEAFSRRVSTYDDRGNLIKQENIDGFDEWDNYTLTYTYDEQDRILTRTRIGYSDNATVYTYVYDEEGNYYYSTPDKTTTNYYDKNDRLIKTELVNNETGKVQYLEEFRYDDKGNEVYNRTLYDDSETVHTTTYNELGLVLTAEVKYDGEVYAMTSYTYDEAGRTMFYERFSGNNIWGWQRYTYDEQGRMLTKKSMNQSGWENLTYTYDEAGNRTKTEGQSSNGTFTDEYTCDHWGNWLTYRKYATQEEGDVAIVAAAEWQVQYYPDGIPEDVQVILSNADY